MGEVVLEGEGVVVPQTLTRRHETRVLGLRGVEGLRRRVVNACDLDEGSDQHRQNRDEETSADLLEHGHGSLQPPPQLRVEPDVEDRHETKNGDGIEAVERCDGHLHACSEIQVHLPQVRQ